MHERCRRPSNGLIQYQHCSGFIDTENKCNDMIITTKTGRQKRVCPVDGGFQGGGVRAKQRGLLRKLDQIPTTSLSWILTNLFIRVLCQFVRGAESR